MAVGRATIAMPSTIGPVADRRLLGPGWSSRLLQGVLLDLLTDPAAVAQISKARSAYATRRATLLDVGQHCLATTPQM